MSTRNKLQVISEHFGGIHSIYSTSVINLNVHVTFDRGSSNAVIHSISGVSIASIYCTLAFMIMHVSRPNQNFTDSCPRRSFQATEMEAFSHAACRNQKRMADPNLRSLSRAEGQPPGKTHCHW